MNWGYKIMVVIIAFIIGMLSMVFVAFKQTNDMIDEHYYEKEMKYQSLIDAAQNLNEVNDSALMEQESGQLLLRLPASLLSGFQKGKLEFLRIDDKKKDFTLDFIPDSSGVFLIDNANFIRGAYKARIQWKSHSKDYYREQNIVLK